MRALLHPPKHLRWVHSPLLIFAAALAVRLAVMAHLLAGFGAAAFLLNNECARIASALVHGAGYSSPWSGMPVAPTAQQPPLYPLLLAGVFRIFGAYTRSAAVAALTINALAGAATAVLLRELGERCLDDRRAAVAAAWIFALWPYEAVVGLQLWNQALAALLLVGFLLLAAASLERRRSFGLGCYAGAATLLNPALLPPFACAYSARRLTRRALLVMAGFLLVLAPWTARNLLVFGRFIPLRDNFGFELWVGNQEGLPLRHPLDFRGDFPSADLRAAGWNEIKFLDGKSRQARQYIQAHPDEFVRRCAWRVLEFWMTPDPASWLGISLLAWAGAILAWPRDRSFLLILAAFPLVYYLTHVWPNYRYPIEPIMILLAAYAVVQGVVKAGQRLVSRTAPAGRRAPASVS
jgi:hypothetical protein